jgi:hypothetical protein
MHAQDKSPPPSKRNRKARNVPVIDPADPNYDTLMFSMMKRERARAKRREQAARTKSAS